MTVGIFLSYHSISYMTYYTVVSQNFYKIRTQTYAIHKALC